MDNEKIRADFSVEELFDRLEAIGFNPGISPLTDPVGGGGGCSGCASCSSCSPTNCFNPPTGCDACLGGCSAHSPAACPLGIGPVPFSMTH